MIKKLQCQDCGQAEYGEDLYNYDNKILCRYCIVSRVCEGSTPCEYVGTCNDKTCPNNDQQIDQLKQQLAEKDKEINSLIVDYEKRISQEQELMSNMEHLLTEKQNAIDEINKEFVQAVHDWKTLCAKKDKEIEELKTKQELTFIHSKEDYFQRCNLLEEENVKLQFAQTQLAIAELEKVKNFICDYSEITGQAWNHTLRFLNNKIKELKGEKDAEG